MISDCRSVTAQNGHSVDRLQQGEEHFRLLADSAPVLIWISGPDKLCTFFNKPWLDFTGRTLEQELGDGWVDGVHPADRDRCLAIYQSAFDAHEDFSMDYRLRRADGVYRWMLDKGVPNFEPDGSFAGYIGSCADITGRKEMEEALSRSEQRYRAFFELNAVGATETRLPSGQFIRVNDAFCVMTGYSRDELLAMRFIDLCHPDEIELSLEHFRGLALGEVRHYGIEKRYLRKDGEVIWVQLDVSSGPDDHGPPQYAIAIIQNITERRATTEALAEANRRYKLATSSGRVSVWEWDTQTNVLVADDRKLSELQGFEDERRVTGPDWLDVVHPADRDRIQPAWTALAQGTVKAADFEYRIVNQKGDVWWQDTRCQVSACEAGQVRRIIGVTVDITERKAMEEALRLGEERYRAFFELNAVGAAEVDLAAGRYLRVNDAYCQMLGYSRDELLKVGFIDITYPDDRAEDLQQFGRLVRGEIPDYRLEKRYIRKNGKVMWGQLTATLIRDSAGNPASEIGLVLDITGRKHAEQELQRLASGLLQSQDEERRRIARGLHDQTAQSLLGISLNLAELLETRTQLDEEARNLLTESLDMGRQQLQEVRTLSYLLHPPLLDEVGLQPAVSWYVDGFAKRSGLHVEFIAAPDISRLPADVETALFRVVQESLTNIHRHAGSARVWIRLTRQDDRVVLEVQDAGCGLAVADDVADGQNVVLGVGIAGMRQRMLQLGGELHIRSGAKGSTVTAIVPLEEAHHDYHRTG